MSPMGRWEGLEKNKDRYIVVEAKRIHVTETQLQKQVVSRSDARSSSRSEARSSSRDRRTIARVHVYVY